MSYKNILRELPFWMWPREGEALYDLEGNLLYKYRSDQPRVSAGGPDGGQWTSEGGAVQSNDTPLTIQEKLKEGIQTGYGLVKPVASNSGIKNQGVKTVNIFVGGLLDDTHHGNVKRSDSLQSAIGNNYYFTWNAKNIINDFISHLPAGTKIFGAGVD